jgi:hypothetical protein
MMTGALAAVSAAALVAGGASAGGAAQSGKPAPFSASYSGTAVTKVTGSDVAISANGAGTGSIVGASKVSGKGTGDSSNPPCVPFTGPGTITVAGGAKLNFAVQPGSTGCAADDQKHVTVSGKAIVNGGSGKFAKARGAFKLSGQYDRGKGVFSVKFTGTLTL